jgi:hypothetical protein
MPKTDKLTLTFIVIAFIGVATTIVGVHLYVDAREKQNSRCHSKEN